MRARNTFLVMLLLAAACAACASVDGAASDGAPATTGSAQDGRGSSPTTAPSTTATMPDGERVAVQAVLDGDSLAVERNGERTEVRLAGINAPERDECFGSEAKARLQELVGVDVILVSVPDEEDRDQFGRLLRNVWSGGAWLNLAMVESGAAIALQLGTEDEQTLVDAEEGAWENGAGLWASAACGPFTPGMRITDIRYDPPGRDFENKEEEFVLVGNEGDEVVDVSGWILRDESSTHRFVFPADLQLAPGDGVRIRSGCGEDAGRDLYWCANDAVWSNGGDTVLLQTSEGTVVDRWKYPGDF